jgi:hypothetical protein
MLAAVVWMCVHTSAAVAQDDDLPRASDGYGNGGGTRGFSVGDGEVDLLARPSRAAEMSPAVISQLADDDPSFGKYVDWGQLAAGIREMNSGHITDVALGLAEAERILERNHVSGITSDQLVAKAAVVANRTQDDATFKRLSLASERLKKPEWEAVVQAARVLLAPQRSVGPQVALSSVNPELANLLESVHQTIADAELTNDKASLEVLKKEISVSTVLAKEEKEYVMKELDAAVGSITGDANAAELVFQQLVSVSRSNSDVMNRRHWSGLTFGQMAEQFFAAYVFPPSAQMQYKGITVGLQRDNVICERFESNGRGGYWITCRARYSGYVKILGKKVKVGAERVRVYYDNGGIRADLGGIKGAVDTRSIGKWVQDNFPKRL